MSLTPHVQTFASPEVRQMCVVAELTVSPMLRDVVLEAQNKYHDLNKFKEESWSPSVSDIEWTELMQCIFQSVECGDLVALCGVASTFVVC